MRALLILCMTLICANAHAEPLCAYCDMSEAAALNLKFTAVWAASCMSITCPAAAVASRARLLSFMTSQCNNPEHTPLVDAQACVAFWNAALN